MGSKQESMARAKEIHSLAVFIPEPKAGPARDPQIPPRWQNSDLITESVRDPGVVFLPLS